MELQRACWASFAAELPVLEPAHARSRFSLLLDHVFSDGRPALGNLAITHLIIKTFQKMKDKTFGFRVFAIKAAAELARLVEAALLAASQKQDFNKQTMVGMLGIMCDLCQNMTALACTFGRTLTCSLVLHTVDKLPAGSAQQVVRLILILSHSAVSVRSWSLQSQSCPYLP